MRIVVTCPCQLVVVNLEDCYISTMKTGMPIPDITGMHPRAEAGNKITRSGPALGRDTASKDRDGYFKFVFDHGGVIGTGEPSDAHAPITAAFGTFHDPSLAVNFNREAIAASKARKAFYQALQKPSRWNAVLKKGYVLLACLLACLLSPSGRALPHRPC